ncbi:MAG: hypothetical protein MMC33_010235 [Icmadophila ericetorum]|nr:hypothetical protein [Icmadophila ericetorum]
MVRTATTIYSLHPTGSPVRVPFSGSMESLDAARLCYGDSTTIHNIVPHCQSDSTLAIAFFYFDFNDTKKQNPENLIRSLIKQLSGQSTNTPETLNTLYSRSQDGQQQPTTDDLESTLQQMVKDFHQVFFVLDALDECTEREELMELIGHIVGWKAENLHLLTTSRRESGITETLEPLTTGQISIQNEVVNADIQIHLRNRLRNDSKLRKFRAHERKEIETKLMNGAHGM